MMAMRMMVRAAIGMMVALGLIGSANSASAASWKPDKPVRLLIPFAPGGGADALSRAITPKLHDALGQPWVNDNRGGAGGNIAAEIVVRANPDGQTVFFGFSNVLTVNPLMYKLPFDPVKELIPVAMLNSGHYMLVLHPSVKADNFGEFIALAKSKAGAMSYASSGIGTPLHLAAELFKVRTGTQLTHVPYKGGGPASIAVLAGEVQVLFGSLPSVLPHVKGGRLKALAVTGPKRAVLAPEVPTISELGQKDFEVTSWYGFFLPLRTPDNVVQTLMQESRKVLEMPDVKEAIAKLGIEPAFKSGAEFARHIRLEMETWAKVIKSAGIRAE
jgi:tripartite-type tricarboxylate transporter receptor subunit TctC